MHILKWNGVRKVALLRAPRDKRAKKNVHKRQKKGEKEGKVKEKTSGYYLVGGGLTGIVNGLLGGGGGMLAVPVLQRNMIAQKAHATAIAVILPASIVSGIVYLLSGYAPTEVLLPVTAGAVLGGFLGAKLLSRVPARPLTFFFALLMLAAGVKSVIA